MTRRYRPRVQIPVATAQRARSVLALGTSTADFDNTALASLDVTLGTYV